MPRETYTRRRPYRPNTYNYTSEAYEYYPSHPYPRRGREYGERELAQRPKKKKASTYYVKEENSVIMGKIAIGMVVFFGFALCVLFSSIDISKKRTEIITLTSELENINETNNYLETELNKSIDLTEIEKIATTKLGMQSPTKYQTVYIDVPKDSYTVQYSEVEEEKGGFVNFLKGLFS